MEPVLFVVGAVIGREGAQSDAGASLEHPDAAGARRPPTRRAGRICANSFTKNLGRTIPFKPDLL